MEDELRDIVARTRIRDLYSRYCFALDSKNAADLADCFTEDGAFVNENGAFVGREAVNELLLPALETHYSINVEVIGSVDGSESTYSSRACFLLLHADESRVATHGQYDDRVRRGEDGVWRFEQRKVTFLWMSDDYAARRSAHSAASMR